jgi:hypothetical protein
VTSTLAERKTTCRTCGRRRSREQFPKDRFSRPVTRKCMPCSGALPVDQCNADECTAARVGGARSCIDHYEGSKPVCAFCTSIPANTETDQKRHAAGRCLTPELREANAWANKEFLATLPRYQPRGGHVWAQPKHRNRRKAA